MCAAVLDNHESWPFAERQKSKERENIIISVSNILAQIWENKESQCLKRISFSMVHWEVWYLVESGDVIGILTGGKVYLF